MFEKKDQNQNTTPELANVNATNATINISTAQSLYASDKLKRAVQQYMNSVHGSANIYSAAIVPDSDASAKTDSADEWIWVEGYKGTNRNMCCRDYQFELGKQFDMPEGSEIDLCHSGFHLCKNLRNVYNYYNILDGNRFFKVKALVRERDADNPMRSGASIWRNGLNGEDKLASKSIVFLEELSTEEIFDAYGRDEMKAWSLEDKTLAREKGVSYVRELIRHRDDPVKIATLVELGYSETFARYIVVDREAYGIAFAVGSQKDLSMDMKVFMILKDED